MRTRKLRREIAHWEASTRSWAADTGIAPLAVTAVYHLHGARALVDHPGLAPLRCQPRT